MRAPDFRPKEGGAERAERLPVSETKPTQTFFSLSFSPPNLRTWPDRRLASPKKEKKTAKRRLHRAGTHMSHLTRWPWAYGAWRETKPTSFPAWRSQVKNQSTYFFFCVQGEVGATESDAYAAPPAIAPVCCMARSFWAHSKPRLVPSSGTPDSDESRRLKLASCPHPPHTGWKNVAVGEEEGGEGERGGCVALSISTLLYVLRFPLPEGSAAPTPFRIIASTSPQYSWDYSRTQSTPRGRL
jgi:hypothetical protein